MTKKPREYQRVLKILDDYWLSQPDEKIVIVEMFFVNGATGEKQHKIITWRNPKYLTPAEDSEDLLVNLSEIKPRDPWAAEHIKRRITQ